MGNSPLQRKAGERGFTLVELLTVVSIVGILSAIAIPQFSEYRARAYDARAESDLRNLVSSEEAYYSIHEAYAACRDARCESPGLPGFERSDGVAISSTLLEGGAGFSATSQHSKGTKVYNYSSINGKIVPSDPSSGSSVG